MDRYNRPAQISQTPTVPYRYPQTNNDKAAVVLSRSALGCRQGTGKTVSLKGRYLAKSHTTMLPVLCDAHSHLVWQSADGCVKDDSDTLPDFFYWDVRPVRR